MDILRPFKTAQKQGDTRWTEMEGFNCRAGHCFLSQHNPSLVLVSLVCTLRSAFRNAASASQTNDATINEVRMTRSEQRARRLAALRSAPKHTLYRCFDATGRLLYVGITGHMENRFSQHRRASSWFSECTRVTNEGFASRQEAVAAERKAISEERPLHNVADGGCGEPEFGDPIEHDFFSLHFTGRGMSVLNRRRPSPTALPFQRARP
jgi:predicted GIY-YIG superfamily endonuclease